MLIHLPKGQSKKLIKNYGGSSGKRYVFRPEQKELRVEQKRRSGRKEFQIFGAAKVKERLPGLERISGRVSKLEPDDLRVRQGSYEDMISKR